MQLLADNKVSAYEYLDGREIFTDQYKINVRDMLDRFHIYYQPAKGSTDKIRASPSRKPTYRPTKCCRTTL